MSALKCYKLYAMTCMEIYNASLGSWAPVLRVIYLLNLTGQKQYVTELKWIWPIIMSEDSPEIISSPANTAAIIAADAW